MEILNAIVLFHGVVFPSDISNIKDGNMIRTILVTKIENRITKEVREIYGRYDAVKLEKDNYRILDSFKRKYTMSDSDFAKYGKVAE